LIESRSSLQAAAQRHLGKVVPQVLEESVAILEKTVAFLAAHRAKR